MLQTRPYGLEMLWIRQTVIIDYSKKTYPTNKNNPLHLCLLKTGLEL